ncbi:DUF501 domain-containing protein [Mesotoga sp. H07.pep.5.3]|uniref:DUF501 domain-containing protein n=1 Tax=Mesotoga sp. H07.pep.5.3 TaxID=1421003 RepID=UPI000C1762A2|nr:DUF501 domain-containing protein [Mesotoga sp. H07.pep.5.3]PIJ63272.1 hypothetical protein V513_01165 [Mesotoga sp. H07.pep.5.3]
MESNNIEEKIISLQLKKVVKNDFIVVRLCDWGFPQVIESSLISDGRPFPTLFWLTCPFLKEEVSRLESKGMISHFEKRIEHDKSFATAFFDAHRETTLLKEKILCEASVSEESRRLILDRGIGGIRNLKKVKCLHLHLASYLGGIDNPVGREVWNLLEKKQCSSTKIICRELLRENE